MCGIPGWVSLGLDLNREQPTLDEMTETMACREPAVPGSTSGTASTRSATGGSPDTSRRSTNSAASQLCRSVIRWARTGLDAISGAAVRVGVGTRFYYDGEGVEVVEMLSSPSVHIPDQRSTETYPNHTGPWVLPTRCSYAVGYPLMRCSTELSSVGWDLLVGYCVEELAPLWIPRDLLQVHCHDLAVQFGIHVVREAVSRGGGGSRNRRQGEPGRTGSARAPPSRRLSYTSTPTTGWRLCDARQTRSRGLKDARTRLVWPSAVGWRWATPAPPISGCRRG